MKYLELILAALLVPVLSCKSQPLENLKPLETKFSIPLQGNAFVINESSGAVIDKDGLVKWSSNTSKISTYFRIERTGMYSLKLNAKSGLGGTVKVELNDLKKEVKLSGVKYNEHLVGVFEVKKPGYLKLDLQGISKTGATFGEVSDVLVEGDIKSDEILFSNDPEFYYWARRGPSCHLNYEIPTTENISYYYSEIMVPEGQDQIGSYFMANGFSEGYFGIQVNSDTERRILFSLWSPYKTDNPNEVPEDERIKLLKKGKDVNAGTFGNEGTGGQTFLRYLWKAGNTYRFLLKGEPDEQGNTDYTAWFFAPEKGEWQLISSLKRPKINTYLKGFHGFLENFKDSNGYLRRKAIYKNQWVRTASGHWFAITKARFSVDNTYKAKQRIDAQGGVENGFYLENGGYFDSDVKPGTTFTLVNPSSVSPEINFRNLP